MTTIAYRQGHLAADTLVTRGNTQHRGAVKIAQRGDEFAAAAGSIGYNAKFLAWFSAGEQGDPPEAKVRDDYCDLGVIIRADDAIELYEDTGNATIRVPYMAFGSGRDVALGAMFVGADAEQAVRAAIEHDAYTGGSVTVLRRGVW